METKNIKFLAIGITCMMLGACTPTTAQRGNMLEDYQIESIVIGVHTRSDVLRIMGSPTTQAPFDDNVWYYIGQQTEKHGILDPEVVKERIIIVSFNGEGIIQSINESDTDRINIPIERTKTLTHGNDITIMQQFLGNLGRFNTEGAE